MPFAMACPFLLFLYVHIVSRHHDITHSFDVEIMFGHPPGDVSQSVCRIKVLGNACENILLAQISAKRTQEVPNIRFSGFWRKSHSLMSIYFNDFNVTLFVQSFPG